MAAPTDHLPAVVAGIILQEFAAIEPAPILCSSLAWAIFRWILYESPGGSGEKEEVSCHASIRASARTEKSYLILLYTLKGVINRDEGLLERRLPGRLGVVGGFGRFEAQIDGRVERDSFRKKDSKADKIRLSRRIGSLKDQDVKGCYNGRVPGGTGVLFGGSTVTLGCRVVDLR